MERKIMNYDDYPQLSRHDVITLKLLKIRGSAASGSEIRNAVADADLFIREVDKYEETYQAELDAKDV